MKKKVLVIGANGFTGRRILNDLSRNDEYIVTGCSLHDDIAPRFRELSFHQCRHLPNGGTKRIVPGSTPEYSDQHVRIIRS